MTLAQKIQKHRKMRGMTQEELAEALNVSHQSISKWESAQATPGIDKILLLSEYFKISTDALLKEGTESAPVPPHLPTPAPLPASTSLPADAPPASVAKAPADPDRQKPKWLFILGLTVSVAGLLGLGALWFMSLLYPPYTFDKPLGPVEKFSFYIRYNEIEPLAVLAASAMLAGIVLMVLHRLRRKRAV